MEPAVLETENLVKVYGRGANRFDALKGLTLEIRRGESVAVIGKSGSGKSTLMHLMALLDRPSQGVVALNGRPVSELKNKEIHKLRNESFGFVFQQFFLNPNQTVLENVVLPLKIAGVAKRERNRRGMEALERLEMADKAKNKATDLSGGQKQRACIARALVTSPSVIFADEPTGNLDSNTSEVVEEILFGLQREQGITLVIVTHDDDLAAKCDRRIYLKDGEIVQAEEIHADSAGAPAQGTTGGEREDTSTGAHVAPAPQYPATEPWAAPADSDGPKHREEGTR
ncbi:ABC transporter ATP-binding protein [Kocuria coralli]|uniref:ABC transporter ATP-binding protein n=1 Tax=Kocuria coralli TaxID=1461025 RepID=A0A5J5KX97_9MICC|nr:ABC transporter ATP-binding protein [Kocuria coralli]KAA9394274.1 ABC transporter ATP-binding protein [Kocuria coralli]